MLLLSIRKIMVDFCANIHFNNINKQPISLLNYAKNLMITHMKKAEREMIKKSEQSSESTISSDSETENVDNFSQFSDVVEDYAHDCPADQMGRYQKKLFNQLKKSGVHRLSLNLLDYSTTFRLLAKEYRDKISNGNVNTFAVNRARFIFSDSAQHILRIGNSSSLLERSFSDSIRSLSSRRHKLRNNLITPFKYIYFERKINQIFKSMCRLDEETFLRSLSKQLEPIKHLAETLEYDSDKYQRMMSLHKEQTMEDRIKQDLLTDYENVSLLYYKLSLTRYSGSK